LQMVLSHWSVSSVVVLAVLALASAKTGKFRMEKVNYIYDKAIQRIQDKQRLAKFEGELGGFDRILIENKEHKETGKYTKEEASTIDRKLRSLLEKYDLGTVLDAFEKVLRAKNLKPPPRKPTKQEKAGKAKATAEIDLASVQFGDEKLQKLWSAAQNQKFAKDELRELYSELLELEQKQQHLEDALHALSKSANENHIESEDDAHIQMELKNKRAKEANRAVHAHYDDLHKKVLNQEFAPFENAKVKKLWTAAQQSSNMTSYDLDVIREELVHFDKQLKKLDAHKEEAERARETVAKSTLEELENTELEAKHERLDRKLKKLEKYLVTKIKHSEL
ncbi:hypothetical protein PFISCL1PPCAC_2976, partial [Pristionchus fissidentatus]